jgi:hypothetical protein
MTATKNNVPPSSTLVMTALVPRNIPSSKNCTLRSPVRFQSTKRTLHVLLLPTCLTLVGSLVVCSR